MAECRDMKQGDRYVCKNCGLELKVEKACSCSTASGPGCTVPLQCCNQEMVKA
ncbi:MAG: hypothetical protein R6U50_03825 [Desulfobacterales bacterium]